MDPPVELLSSQEEATRELAISYITSVPKLKELLDQQLISVENPHNASYGDRSIDQQRGEGSKSPSNAFKFAIIPVSEGKQVEFDSSKQVCWHGNISGEWLSDICKRGLLAYKDGLGPLRPKGTCLVTPSWITAAELYGYSYKAPDLSEYRIWLQGRCGEPVLRNHNTFTGGTGNENSVDELISDGEIEWVLKIEDVQITGVIVKRYRSARSIEKLGRYINHPHRNWHINTPTLVYDYISNS